MYVELVNSKVPPPEAFRPPALPTVYTNLFGGRGEVRVWSLLHAESEPFTAALSCELAPAGAVGRHLQQEFPELVLGIAGDGEVRVDGVPQRFGPFSAVYLPLGSTLEIINRSASEPLRYLIVKARIASAAL